MKNQNYVKTVENVKKILSEYYRHLFYEFWERSSIDPEGDIKQHYRGKGEAMRRYYEANSQASGWQILKEKYHLDITTMDPGSFALRFEGFIMKPLQEAENNLDAIDNLFGKGDEGNIVILFCSQYGEGGRKLAEKLTACAQLQKTLLTKVPGAPTDDPEQQSLERLKQFKAQLNKPSVLEKNRNENWNKCFTAISFLLFPIAALRALESYARHGTGRFWISEGKKVKAHLQEILEENVPPGEKSSPKPSE